MLVTLASYYHWLRTTILDQVSAVALLQRDSMFEVCQFTQENLVLVNVPLSITAPQ